MTKKFKVGDLVSFLLVGRKVKGVITEDRGNLGVGGRRIYDVLVRYESSDPMHYELPDTDLEFVGRATYTTA